MISTNKDRKGKEFVSTAEAKAYPIYATQVWGQHLHWRGWRKCSTRTTACIVLATKRINLLSHHPTRKQWHPERPQFEWVVEDSINHDAPTIEAMQWVGRFLASEVRQKCVRAFDGRKRQ